MNPRTVIQVMEAASGVSPERWTPPAPELRARLLQILGHALNQPDVMFIRCNPEEAMFAELEEDHRRASEERERSLDLAHPQTRCDLCQEVWDHGLTPMGGTLLCDPCLVAVAV